MIDMLLYISLNLLLMAFFIPSVFSPIEFTSTQDCVFNMEICTAPITYRQPHPVFLTYLAIFSFFFWVFLGIGFIKIYQKVFKRLKE